MVAGLNGTCEMLQALYFQMSSERLKHTHTHTCHIFEHVNEFRLPDFFLACSVWCSKNTRPGCGSGEGREVIWYNFCQAPMR